MLNEAEDYEADVEQTQGHEEEQIVVTPIRQKSHSVKPRCQFGEGCEKQAQTGGFCLRHGGKGSKCKWTEGEEVCPKYAKKGGFCVRHGGKKPRCKQEGCEKQAQRGGFCLRHEGGCWVKKCSHEGCEKYAKKAGLCMIHHKFINGNVQLEVETDEADTDAGSDREGGRAAATSITHADGTVEFGGEGVAAGTKKKTKSTKKRAAKNDDDEEAEPKRRRKQKKERDLNDITTLIPKRVPRAKK